MEKFDISSTRLSISFAVENQKTKNKKSKIFFFFISFSLFSCIFCQIFQKSFFRIIFFFFSRIVYDSLPASGSLPAVCTIHCFFSVLFLYSICCFCFFFVFRSPLLLLPSFLPLFLKCVKIINTY